MIAAFLTYLKAELVKRKLILRLPLVPEDSRFPLLLREYSSLLSENLSVEERVMTYQNKDVPRQTLLTLPVQL